MNARAPIAATNIIFVARSKVFTPWNRAWKVIHSLKKPLNGGRAEMASEPVRKKKAVCGMTLMSPPYSSMFRVWVSAMTAPAPRNSRALNVA